MNNSQFNNYNFNSILNNSQMNMDRAKVLNNIL